MQRRATRLAFSKTASYALQVGQVVGDHTRQVPQLTTGKGEFRTTFPVMLALTHQTGIRLAEVAFLLLVIAGIWLVVGEIETSRLKLHKVRTIVAGGAVAVAGVLLIIATHWGRFG